MPSPYQGVILAAGRGSRMGPLADHYPKALLPILNVPLILRHVETLRALEVQEIIIVVGYQAGQIQSLLGDGQDHGISIRYVHQHERQGLAHAVATLEPHITAPFYLLLGDIYFEFTRLGAAAHLFESQGAAAVLAVQDDVEPATVQRNFSVTRAPGGRVLLVVEKPQAPEVHCKGCGLYLFDRRIFDAIRRTPRSALRNEFELTDAIQTLIDDDAPVYGVQMTAWDINITVPADLIICNTRFLRAQNLSHIIGAGCDIAPGVVLDQCAVGDGVHIAHPIHLQRCVVLPGTVVDSETDLCDVILAPGLTVR